MSNAVLYHIACPSEEILAQEAKTINAWMQVLKDLAGEYANNMADYTEIGDE